MSQALEKLKNKRTSLKTLRKMVRDVVTRTGAPVFRCWIRDLSEDRISPRTGLMVSSEADPDTCWNRRLQRRAVEARSIKLWKPDRSSQSLGGQPRGGSDLARLWKLS